MVFTRKWLCIESSRGLPGIDEIKRLLNGEKLTLKLTNNEKLTFNISGMSQEIKPLRTATGKNNDKQYPYSWKEQLLAHLDEQLVCGAVNDSD